MVYGWGKNLPGARKFWFKISTGGGDIPGYFLKKRTRGKNFSPGKKRGIFISPEMGEILSS